jgi:transposase-like protein
MNIHKNARLTPYRRGELVQRLTAGETGAAVARAFGVSVRTVRKWWARYRDEGLAGLADRSSRPHVSPRQTVGCHRPRHY